MDANKKKILKEKHRDIANYTQAFMLSILDIVTNEENNCHIDVTDDNINEVMTGLIMGVSAATSQLIEREPNHLEFVNFVNKITVQYLIQANELRQ